MNSQVSKIRSELKIVQFERDDLAAKLNFGEHALFERIDCVVDLQNLACQLSEQTERNI